MQTILRTQHPTMHLEPRQVDNLINTAKRAAAGDVSKHVGDLNAQVRKLEDAHQQDIRNTQRLLISDDNRVVGEWWQTAVQSGLTERYPELVLVDDSYGWNRYGWPLCVGFVIANLDETRNAW